MERGQAITLGCLLVALSAVAASAPVAGKWVFNQNTCNSGVSFTITETKSGTMNFPGSQTPLRDIQETDNEISFYVDEPQTKGGGTYFVSYFYYGTVANDRAMTGSCIELGNKSTQGSFSASRN